MRYRDDISVFRIRESFALAVVMVMVFVTFPLSDDDAQFAMFQRTMNDPLEQGIEEDTGDDGSCDQQEGL